MRAPLPVSPYIGARPVDPKRDNGRIVLFFRHNVGQSGDMDDTDRKLLHLLGDNARRPVAELARELGLARSTVQARLERLERDGTIAGYALRLGGAARASQIRATVLLALVPRANASVVSRLRAMTEVKAAHTASGRADLVLELAAASPEALDQCLDTLGAMEGVKSTETLIHLTTKIDRHA